MPQLKIYHLLPELGAIRKKLNQMEAQIQQEYGISLELTVSGLDAACGVDTIAKLVSDVLSVPMNRLIGTGRVESEREARQIAMYLSDKYIDGIAQAEIARYFSKDHSTVIHSVKRIATFLENEDARICKAYQACEIELLNRIKANTP